MIYRGPATALLVDALLCRGSHTDVQEAQAAIDRLAAMPTDPGLVLLAKAHGDETGYRDFRDRYRAMATELGFEGHIAWAEAMP